MKTIVIYPRGFLGYDIGLPVVKVENGIKDILDSVYYNKSLVNKDRTVISNTEIENLFKALIQQSWSGNSFEYRERVLKAALTAFGTKSFFDWCQLQNESPYFTDLHRRFLNDTFEFIKTGKRVMAVGTWASIIRPRAIASVDRSTDYKVSDYFRLNQGSLLRRPFGITDNIINWTSQPGGVEDMVATLHILFGDLPS